MPSPRVVALAALVGCGARAPTPPPEPPAPAPAAPAPRIVATLLSDRGGAWGEPIAVAPEPASLVRGCFAGARGWVYVGIALGARASQTSLVESSPLADEVTSCVVEKLRALHAVDPAVSAPPALVYVSSG